MARCQCQVLEHSHWSHSPTLCFSCNSQQSSQFACHVPKLGVIYSSQLTHEPTHLWDESSKRKQMEEAQAMTEQQRQNLEVGIKFNTNSCTTVLLTSLKNHIRCHLTDCPPLLFLKCTILLHLPQSHFIQPVLSIRISTIIQTLRQNAFPFPEHFKESNLRWFKKWFNAQLIEKHLASRHYHFSHGYISTMLTFNSCTIQ